jgi:hypothetical protein
VRVAVGIWVDGSLEPREQLVGAAVDGDAALRVGLPARDADRQERRAGRDSVEPLRAAVADDEPRELRAMALGPTRLRRVLLGRGVAARIQLVDPREQPTRP